jgi:hypothetical protein
MARSVAQPSLSVAPSNPDSLLVYASEIILPLSHCISYAFRLAGSQPLCQKKLPPL